VVIELWGGEAKDAPFCSDNRVTFPSTRANSRGQGRVWFWIDTRYQRTEQALTESLAWSPGG